MPLKDTLSGILVRTEGALAVMVMAYDGIALVEAAVSQSEFDLQLLSVEYATALKAINRAVEVLAIGQLEAVSIATEKLRVVMQPINRESFAVLIMSVRGNTGKGRYLLRLNSFELDRELS